MMKKVGGTTEQKQWMYNAVATKSLKARVKRKAQLKKTPALAMAASPGTTAVEVEDFSASATIIYFNPPIPLLRGPLPDDPSSVSGPFVLAFKDANSWKSAFRSCQSKLRHQCEGGARIGCSISASSKCKPPWWTTLFGLGSNSDFSEREQCEEREMLACLAISEESCIKFAKDKCVTPFGDARIATIGQKEPSKSTDESCISAQVTSYRGSSLLGSETPRVSEA